MRPVRIGTLGFGALLLGCVLLGCASDNGETPFDAGELPDGIGGGGGEDSPLSNADAGATTASGDASDATVSNPTPDSGSAPEDAGDSSAHAAADSSVTDSGLEKADASDASHADAGHDAGEADASHADASDGAPGMDASDAAVVDSATPEDSSSPSPDASSTDASDDSDAPVADSAVACVSCGVTVSFLGNSAAYVSSNGTPVTLMGGTVADGQTVSATTQTYPKGSAAAHLIYSTNASFTPATDVVMTYDTNQPAPNNDQWYAIIPVESASTTVYWYVEAEGCDCATTRYDPGNFMNFTYTEQ